MKSIHIFAAAATLSLTFGAHAGDKSTSWVTGAWTATSDEDGTPADFMEFRADGTYVNYGFDCSVASEMPFHGHAGDIYVTSEVLGKGPISIVFRPSQDKSKLTYTSPRTRNNAVYERLSAIPCKREG